MIDTASVEVATKSVTQVVDKVDNVYALITVMVLCAAGCVMLWIWKQKPRGEPRELGTNGKTLITANALMEKIEEHKVNCDNVLNLRFDNIDKQFKDGSRKMKTLEIKIEENAKEDGRRHNELVTAVNDKHTEVVAMLASLGAEKKK